ncbi:TIM barrel protein [Pseudomonas alcaligenes]|jgi:hydroxypyruvate isomerase|uniref:hydroxypyruvate isomerase family protein n=1 Tax=Aquipseudomonas alcaligenes TaxID=43263 RepID=UPI002E7AFFAE|nr:TIM barrel protein [Pseudomonas alcaligenes]MEE1949602.1 TIM barrel protein [Pseudomonas alcaligenes]
MRIAANLSLLFTEHPMLERVAAAAAAGFDGVEVQFPYEIPAAAFKEALDGAAMPLVLINLPAGDLMSGGAGLASVPSRQEQFDVALQQALDYAAVVRPLCVNVLPGRLADGVSRDEALDVLVGNLRKAADAFQALGVRVLFEAINPLDMPGFLINTPEHLEFVLDRVGHSNCLAQFDLYHMARQDQDICAGIRQLAGRIGHVQFADCPGRGEPGSGELDFSVLLGELRNCGYRAWIGAEFIPSKAIVESPEWMALWHDADRL